MPGRYIAESLQQAYGYGIIGTSHTSLVKDSRQIPWLFQNIFKLHDYFCAHFPWLFYCPFTITRFFPWLWEPCVCLFCCCMGRLLFSRTLLKIMHVLLSELRGGVVFPACRGMTPCVSPRLGTGSRMSRRGSLPDDQCLPSSGSSEVTSCSYRQPHDGQRS